MSRQNTKIHCSDLFIFDIDFDTRLSMKVECRRTSLVQEVEITRKKTGAVKVWFKEYSGLQFSLRVDIAKNMVALVGVDYSWHHDPEQIPCYVIKCVEGMLKGRRSKT